MWPFTAYELRLVANRNKWDAYIIRWVFIRAVESTEAVNRCEGEEVRRPLYWSSAILKQCITLSSPAPPPAQTSPLWVLCHHRGKQWSYMAYFEEPLLRFMIPYGALPLCLSYSANPLLKQNVPGSTAILSNSKSTHLIPRDHTY